MANTYGLANPLLTRLSIDRRNEAVGFVAEKVSPSIPTGDKSFGEYHVFDQGNNFQNPANEKADGGVSREIFFASTPSNFKTQAYGSRAGYTAKELTDFGDESTLRIAKMNMVTDADMIAHELRVATVVTTAASYVSANKTTLTGTSQWSDLANSDPFDDVETAKQAVISGDAVRANSMIISQNTFSKLKLHPDILSRLQAQNLASGLEDVNIAKIGELFGLDLSVASAQYNSADQGQSFVAAYAWGNFALIFHKTPSAGKQVISLAYTFSFQDFQMRTYFDTPSKKTYVDNDHDVVTKLVAASVGYLITNPIA